MDTRRGSVRSAPPPGPVVAAERPVRPGETVDAVGDLIAATVAALVANGAESDRVVDRAGQLARAVGGRVDVTLGWTESSITVTDRHGATATRRFPATPASVGMNRVMAVDDAVDAFVAGRRSLTDTAAAVARARTVPPANTALFAAACAVGASCLAVIFGVDHWQAVALIALAAGAAGVLRRVLAHRGATNFAQVAAAALLAGLIGSTAVHLGLSSPLRLAAVCPCMVLVPGPHLLNGSLDIARMRLPLGFARLAFASVTLLAIGVGLLVGLGVGGAGLVLEPAGRDVPLLVDAAAAGVVAVCYGVFYSAPLRILVWPLAVGAGVHALRWVALSEWHAPSWVGAGLACLVAGAVLIPVCRRFRVPFSAVGFASVVSLMPGLLVFRMLEALAMLQDAPADRAAALLQSAVNDASVAGLTIGAMAIGFLVPAGAYRMMSDAGARRAAA